MFHIPRWRFHFEVVVLLNNHLQFHCHHRIGASWLQCMYNNSVHSIHLYVSEQGVTVERWYKLIFRMHQRMWAITWKWDAKRKYLWIEFQTRKQFFVCSCHQELNKWKLWNYFILVSDYLQLVYRYLFPILDVENIFRTLYRILVTTSRTRLQSVPQWRVNFGKKSTSRE